ncbi:MAG: methyltransferase domain-containing protein [Phycisphaerales bacterium]|nr:MAG: methyltransferase domain-containing protein [Phycisphaerales bacterium]
MKVIRRGIFALLCMAVALAGCQASRELSDIEKPTARVLRLRFQGAELDYATLLFDVEVENPTGQDLKLRSLNYSLTSGGSAFLAATGVEEAIVPPHVKAVFSVPHKVFYGRFLKTLHRKGGAHIQYVAEAGLWVEGPKLGLVELPMAHQGHMVLPKAPQIEVEGKKYSAVDVVFITTPQDVVERMLELAEVKESDLVYDLGCGDGRIVVTAAKKYGCRAVGYDIDPRRVQESLENVRAGGVEHLVKIEQKDIFTVDLSEADVVTLYLTSELNTKLVPQLEKLKPGSRIVSHTFGIEGIEPDTIAGVTSKEGGDRHVICLWVTPLRRTQKGY